MDNDIYRKILNIRSPDSNYDSDASSDTDFPDPDDIAQVSYEKERMYIMSTLKHLTEKVRDLEKELDSSDSE